VTIRAAIAVRNGQTSVVPAQAYAYADPSITIDPAFLALHPGYSLAFSANVANAEPIPPPVPVPATGWLFGPALLALARRDTCAPGRCRVLHADRSHGRVAHLESDIRELALPASGYVESA
jgi:hypothetical protein